MNYVTKLFLLVGSSVSSNQPLCFVHGQDQKIEQKHTTKNFVEFHNHFFLLTMFEVRGKRRSKIVKINANLDRVSKPALGLWFSLFYLPGLLIK